MSSSSTESTESNPSDYKDIHGYHQQDHESISHNAAGTLEEQHITLGNSSNKNMMKLNSVAASLPALSQLDPLNSSSHAHSPAQRQGPGSAYASAMAVNVHQGHHGSTTHQPQTILPNNAPFTPPSVLHQLPPQYYGLPPQLYGFNSGMNANINMNPSAFPQNVYGQSGIFYSPSGAYHPSAYYPNGGLPYPSFGSNSFSTPGSYSNTPTSGGSSGMGNNGSNNGTFGYACDRCREKHQSCDHEKPCKRCVKANLSDYCHYTPKRSRSSKCIQDHHSHQQQYQESRLEMDIAQSPQGNNNGKRLSNSSASRLAKKKSGSNTGLLLDMHQSNQFNPTAWPSSGLWAPPQFPMISNNLAQNAFPFAPKASKFPSGHEMITLDEQMKRPYSAPAGDIPPTSNSSSNSQVFFPGLHSFQNASHEKTSFLNSGNVVNMGGNHGMMTDNNGNDISHPPLPSLLDSLHYKASSNVPSHSMNHNNNLRKSSGPLDHALPESEHANTPSDTPHRRLSPAVKVATLQDASNLKNTQTQEFLSSAEITKKLDASALLAAGILVQESMRDAITLLDTTSSTTKPSESNQS